MIDETVIPAPIEGAENQEATPEVTETFDYEKTDNLSQLRDYAKGLKTDLGKYKPANDFIETSFGDVENAKLASSVYNSFAGEKFEPEEFLKTISQLSPARASQLVESLSAKQATELAKAEVEKILGGKVSAEEVKLFKNWKESGYNLGTDDDIPEALKFDKDGNPKSDEEIQFLRDLQSEVKKGRQEKLTEAQQKELDAQIAESTRVQNDIAEFSTGRIKVLDKEFEAIGLAPTATDTAEERAEKDTIRSFIIDGVSGLFLKDMQGATDYKSAVSHIENGENLLARRYETRIEAKLLEIMRSKSVTRLLQSLTKVESTEERPELSNSGTSQNDSKQTGRMTSQDIFDKLVREGKLNA